VRAVSVAEADTTITAARFEGDGDEVENEFVPESDTQTNRTWPGL
jgi:hypothetical protein